MTGHDARRIIDHHRPGIDLATIATTVTASTATGSRAQRSGTRHTTPWDARGGTIAHGTTSALPVPPLHCQEAIQAHMHTCAYDTARLTHPRPARGGRITDPLRRTPVVVPGRIHTPRYCCTLVCKHAGHKHKSNVRQPIPYLLGRKTGEPGAVPVDPVPVRWGLAFLFLGVRFGRLDRVASISICGVARVAACHRFRREVFRVCRAACRVRN